MSYNYIYIIVKLKRIVGLVPICRVNNDVLQKTLDLCFAYHGYIGLAKYNLNIIFIK